MDALFQKPGPYHAPGTSSEHLLTLHQVAEELGLPYWQIQRAVKRREIPSYRPFNSRPLLKLSEVVAFIDASRQGGAE
ncbi:hypothetical protein EOB59_20670 [Mesorhizobium sp. M7A.F.Ca.MR.176.00.0.0]|uniref:helix-turn-helix transcriptional regulator n=1 Tax=Mesorhizobium sp. M7A.F.Ca.MR.176.00.0.0 TaxID=2496776 RepID=UPI000FD32E36|nr:hypothetical protein [Mesorhizobium sp. M7A.F.Ca.MR.176.00.0.0]RUU88913.1 hypothetical protein EOB59_20670 [Mesorhizobium sp. M7A.F.Ca.MR.176.00.0.0]